MVEFALLLPILLLLLVVIWKPAKPITLGGSTLTGTAIQLVR